MRVLLKDKRDGALAVVDAVEVNYDPSDSELCICLHGTDDYTIEGVDQDAAEFLIRSLYAKGRVDMTDYEAQYNPVWDAESDAVAGDDE